MFPIQNNCRDDRKSAVLLHLMEADHEKITLQNHYDAYINKTDFECSHCGESNDFLVTFASMESNSITVVLSRQMNERYSSRCVGLTDDRQFMSFLVDVPRMSSKKSEKQRLPITISIMSVQDSNFELQSVPLRFRNGIEYEKIFSSLIRLEADYQKKLNQSIRKPVNITLCWSDLKNKKVRAHFTIEYDDAVWKIMLGDRLKLSHSGNGIKWSGVGRVVKLPQNYDESVAIDMDSSEGIPRDCTTGYTVSQVWISASYDRMLSAIKKLVSESSACPNFLFERILGINSNEILFESSSCKLQPAVPSLPVLSKVQENVVRNALQQSLTLIQGPTACGKTVIMLHILYHLIQQNESPILVCAPSNAAVDNLALMINQMKLKVVRLCSESRTFTDSPAHFLSLEKKRTVHLSNEAKKLRTLDEVGTLSPKDAKRLSDIVKAADRHVLEDADVICCTCIGAGDSCLASIKFHAILIDESMQASEPESMIPIALGCDRLVLIGDHFQLKPVIKCPEAKKAGLEKSLFQRLVDIGVIPLHVTVQYRMHPKLWRFSSRLYQGNLQNNIIAAQRKLPDQAFPWPVPDFPLVFYDVKSWQERTWPIMSYLNSGEGMVVEQIVTHFLKRGISPDRLGVITQYEGQRKYIELCLREQGPLDASRYENVEVKKVDEFQGREKDIIILSCVRSPGTKRFGSFSYADRVSLALTRAKYGLIIVGNSKALSKIPYWKDLITFCQQEGLMVETEKKIRLFD